MNILCGYNVNIDSVYRISGIEISKLLETFEEVEILNKIENPPGKIFSSDVRLTIPQVKCGTVTM